MKSHVLVILIFVFLDCGVKAHAVGIDGWKDSGEKSENVLLSLKKVLGSNEIFLSMFASQLKMLNKNKESLRGDAAYGCMLDGGNCREKKCDKNSVIKCDSVKREINEEGGNNEIFYSSLKNIYLFEKKINVIIPKRSDTESGVSVSMQASVESLIKNNPTIASDLTRCLEYHFSFFSDGNNSLVDAGKSDATEEQKNPGQDESDGIVDRDASTDEEDGDNMKKWLKRVKDTKSTRKPAPKVSGGSVTSI